MESDKYCRFQGCGWPATKGRYCDRHATKEARRGAQPQAARTPSPNGPKWGILHSCILVGGLAAITSSLWLLIETSPRHLLTLFRSVVGISIGTFFAVLPIWNQITKVWSTVKKKLFAGGFGLITKAISSSKRPFVEKKLFVNDTMSVLERAAKVGDRDEVNRELKQCKDPGIIQKAIQLANEGKWHAVSKDLQAGFDKLAAKGQAEGSGSPEGKEWLRDRKDNPGSPLGVSPAGAWSDLQSGITRRQAEIIRWVESGGNVNWTCAAGMTLLHYAAMSGNEKMVCFLLDHGANVNAQSNKTGYGRTPLLWACANIQTSVIPILLARGADPKAKDCKGESSLQLIRHSGLAEAEKMAQLLISHGVVPTPGKDAPCPECGSPYSAEMAKRGMKVTLNGVFATFACYKCKKQNEAEIELIDKAKGVRVLCSCGATTYIPPSVWCKTCDNGLSTGWQKQISTGPEAEKASREFNDPGVKRSRALAKELTAAHGKLIAIHFKSHFPNFEIDFDFSDGKRIHSGKSAGGIVGMFAFGYLGGGPTRLQVFLDEMGISISLDEIEKIKPGTTMKVESKASAPPTPAQTKRVETPARRRFCVKCKKSDFGIGVPTPIQKKRLEAGLCPFCEGRLIDF